MFLLAAGCNPPSRTPAVAPKEETKNIKLIQEKDIPSNQKYVVLKEIAISIPERHGDTTRTNSGLDYVIPEAIRCGADALIYLGIFEEPRLLDDKGPRTYVAKGRAIKFIP